MSESIAQPESRPRARAASTKSFNTTPWWSFRERLRRVGAAYVVLAIGLLCSGLIAAYADRQAEARDRLRFASHTVDTGGAITERLARYVDVLHATGGVFAADREVTPDEWEAYLAALDLPARYPGLNAMSYIARVPAAERAAHEARWRGAGRAEYAITPPDERPEYYPLIYLGSRADERLQRQAGFDPFTEPTRRAAMEQARDSGRATITGRITFRSEAGQPSPPSFITFRPVYQAGQATDTVEERRAALRGFVTSSFRVNELLAGIAGQQRDVPIEFAIYDGPVGADRLLYASAPDQPAAGARYTSTALLPVAGQTWTVRYASTPRFAAEAQQGLPWFTLGGGAIISLLLFGLTLSLATGKERAMTLAERIIVDLGISEARAGAVIDSVADGIYQTDAAGRIQLWNRAAEEITGYPARQVLDLPLTDILRPLAAERAFDDQAPPLLRTRTHAGADLWLDVAGVPLRDDQGRPVGEVASFRDVTAAQALEGLKSAFVATVSHEIRTPLTSISGFATTLLRDDIAFSPADQRAYLEIISDETGRLTRLVEDILSVSRIEAGSMKIAIGACDLGALSRDAVDTERANGAGHPFDLALPEPGGEPLLVAADPDKLRRVLLNLLNNAVKYSPEGGPIAVSARRKTEMIEVRVRDSGLGISPADQKHLFEKFFRADAGMSRGIGGTGLGLYITRGLLTRMRGRIWVESEAGEGSTFIFELPIAAGEGVHTHV